MRREMLNVRSGAQLDSWSGFDWSDGIQIDELHPLDTVSVHTHNSVYQIVVRDPESGEILVRGGSRIPAFKPGHLSGCSIGGAVLKRGGIYPGFRLEIEIEGKRLLTSPVVSVDLDPAPSDQ